MMTVRELIDKLLDYKMDAKILIDTRERVVWAIDAVKNTSLSSNAIQIVLSESVVAEKDVEQEDAA